ncbi:MAG: type-F conjugative transfer system protein TraW [Candidatus Puniceispirillum sp.]|nr:type-F conjugative transfer system protein TraW [Candidatus Puniceispirillum sp.]
MKKLSYHFVALALCTSTGPLKARDLGTQGATFVIKEESFLDVIMKRLKTLEASGSLEKHQRDLAKAAQKKARYPDAVPGYSKCKRPHTFYFDPSIIIQDDLKDHRGRVFARKGVRMNPLTVTGLSKDLLFIDGQDTAQVAWALHQDEKHKIILVNGSPLDLENDHKRKFFFDQNGVLSKKFNLTKVPSRVSKEGDRLRIDEVALLQEEGK